MGQDKLLEIEDLAIYYITDDVGTCKAVNHVDLTLERGETLGLVGETGAGKTTIARGILRLVMEPPGKYISGSIKFHGEDLLKKSVKEMQKIRGAKISMIFQDPMTALNPTDPVGEQIAEVLFYQKNLTKAESKKQAEAMMEMVGIPKERYGEYPHQFSGGMKQRIVIAIALACNPELLIADEPTTALDVTIQAQVLDMMRKLKKELGTAMLLITHDLGVVAEMCEKVAIIYAGEVVEMGRIEHIYDETMHPYTIGLFGSLPSVAGTEDRLKPIDGLMPDPADLPPGCKFAPRCPKHCPDCDAQQIPLQEVAPGHWVRCIHLGEV